MEAETTGLSPSVSFPTGNRVKRLTFVLDLAWHLLLQRIASGRVKVNKESSLQLHYAAIIQQLGELLCLEPGEAFAIELESACGKKNIDVVCSLADAAAAIELKCFRKHSNRAMDMDMYHVLTDLERLCSYDGFAVRRFVCLTDNPYYAKAKHGGHAGSVSIRQGTAYRAGTCIKPTWAGKWKNSSLDDPITLGSDVQFDWRETNGWFWVAIDVRRQG